MNRLRSRLQIRRLLSTWTQSPTAPTPMISDRFRKVAQLVMKIPIHHPFAFGVLAATVKTVGVDYLVQRYVEKKERIDTNRLSVFALFGCVYLGAFQYGLFVKLMPRLCPNALSFIQKPWRQKLADKQGLKELGIQLFLENGINNVFIYWPVFYIIQEFLAEGSSGKVSTALDNFSANASTDVPRIWAVWMPVQLFNFAFNPLWARVPFVAVFSAFWTGVVGVTRGNNNNLKQNRLIRVPKERKFVSIPLPLFLSPRRVPLFLSFSTPSFGKALSPHLAPPLHMASSRSLLSRSPPLPYMYFPSSPFLLNARCT